MGASGGEGVGSQWNQEREREPVVVILYSTVHFDTHVSSISRCDTIWSVVCGIDIYLGYYALLFELALDSLEWKELKKMRLRLCGTFSLFCQFSRINHGFPLPYSPFIMRRPFPAFGPTSNVFIFWVIAKLEKEKIVYNQTTWLHIIIIHASHVQLYDNNNFFCSSIRPLSLSQIKFIATMEKCIYTFRKKTGRKCIWLITIICVSSQTMLLYWCFALMKRLE